MQTCVCPPPTGQDPVLVRVTLLFPCPHGLHKAANSRCFTNPGSFWAGRFRGALRAPSHRAGPQAAPRLPFQNRALSPLLSPRLVAMEVPRPRDLRPRAPAHAQAREPGNRCLGARPGRSVPTAALRAHPAPSQSTSCWASPTPVLRCIPDSFSSTLLVTSWQTFYVCNLLVRVFT